EGYGHAGDRCDDDLIPQEYGEQAAQCAQVELVNLAVLLHALGFEHVAYSSGGHDDGYKRPLHRLAPAALARTSGWVRGAVLLTSMTPIIINPMPTHRPRLISSCRQNRPTSATS